ncbi:ABC transporter substrate-binding protein [Streptomyces sp. NPDC008313]|uniref:ABC transporter substrate-binding protein n=1 Tax=Streptomyces sp. NPDC008313 TaxID=3364826 RepID=UPI0036E533F9
MTGRRLIRRLLPALDPAARATALSAGALAACASLLTGCGIIPGVTGGTGDDPVTVMTWAPEGTASTNEPGMPAMAKAYARWVNAHGGLGGRELKVLTCNDHNDTVGAVACARRAVDADVDAVVGSYSQYGRSFLAPISSVGIPYIGGYGVTDDEFTNPLSYPVNGGQPSLLAGLGHQLGRACGPVTLIRPDTVAGDQLPVLLNAGLRSSGHAASADLLAPDDATEYGDQTQRALRGATSEPGKRGCVVTALGDRTDTFMDSFRRAREDYPEVRTATVLGSVDQSGIDAAGGAAGPYEGAYVTGWYPVASDARWKPMREVIKKEAFNDNRIDPGDAGVQTTYVAYTVLKAVVESLGGGEVSARTIRKALDEGLEVRTGGLTPKLSWRFENLIAAVDFPRLMNADVTFQVVRDGRLVAVRRGFINVSKTLEDAD